MSWIVKGVRKAAAYAAGEDKYLANSKVLQHEKHEKQQNHETLDKGDGQGAPDKPRQENNHHSTAEQNVTRIEYLAPRNGASHTPLSAATPSLRATKQWTEVQRDKLMKILNNSVVDIDALRRVSWAGIPQDLRPICWQLMLGYLPPKTSSWGEVATYKRSAYRDLLKERYEVSNSRRTSEELATLRQIAIDAPRTEPTVRLFSKSALQRSLIRVLYVHAVTHPSSGYVQGLNDVLTPFLHAFISRAFPVGDVMETWDVDSMRDDKLIDIEGDCFWCFCKLMDRVEDHYTQDQPGIKKCVTLLETLVERIDPDLHKHMHSEGLECIHFAVRWFNCLLIREFPFKLASRLWDTYIAEGDNFTEYIVYVAVALLLHFSDRLRRMDFQDMIMMLQKLPTHDWSEREVEVTLSTAYMWYSVFRETKFNPEKSNGAN